MTRITEQAQVAARRMAEQADPGEHRSAVNALPGLVQRHLEYQVRADKEFQAHDALDEAAARGAQDALEFAIAHLTGLDQAEVAMLLLEASD